MTIYSEDFELVGLWEQAKQADEGFYEPGGEKDAAEEVIEAGLTRLDRLNRYMSTANDPDTLQLELAVISLRVALFQRQQTVEGFIEKAATAASS